MVMAPLRDLGDGDAARVRAVFTDIDDTLTTSGLLTKEAFAAMWSLHDAGIAVIPVTGRPAGWCDHIARMWPVAGIVGENGAFYFRYDAAAHRMRRRYVLDEDARSALGRNLERLSRRILAEVPRAAVASDQPFRIHDLAIDFAEDVEPPLSRGEIDRVVHLFEAAGATAKISSIHVNGWFGRWDKLSMIRRLARDILDLDLKITADNKKTLYVGDSPNDEPAFKSFILSVGVANIRDFEDRLENPPAFITRAKGGKGFAEIARLLLRARTATADSD